MFLCFIRDSIPFYRKSFCMLFLSIRVHSLLFLALALHAPFMIQAESFGGGLFFPHIILKFTL